MKKTEILEALSDIKTLSFRLRMGLNVIDREEYISLTSKLDRKVEKLIEELNKES